MADQFGNFNISPQMQQLLQATGQYQMPQAGQDIVNALPPAPQSPYAVDPAMDQLLGQQSAATKLGTEAFGQREQRIGGIEQAIDQARMQQQEVGSQSYQPRMGPKVNPYTGVPIAGTEPSLLGKIGRMALAVGASTRPGQNIENVLYSKPREQYARLAATIAGLQQQATGEGQALSAEANMASRPLLAGSRALNVLPNEQRAQAAETTAQAKMADVQRKINAQSIVNQLNLSKADLNKAEAIKASLWATIERQGFATRIDVAKILGSNNVQVKDPTIDRFMNWLGGNGFGPSRPDQPYGYSGGTNTPAAPAAKGGGPSTKKGGTVKWGRDAQGNPVRLNQ